MGCCRKAFCLLPHGKLDGLCTQERYAHEPLPFWRPSCMSVWQVLTLECTYGSHSRWWHGTASRSFAPLQFPSSIGTPWPSAWCRDQDQLYSPMGLVWNLLGKRLWNAKMKLIVWSSSRKCPIPDLPSWGYPLSLQECPSGCMLCHLLPQVWGHTASPLLCTVSLSVFAGLERILRRFYVFAEEPCKSTITTTEPCSPVFKEAQPRPSKQSISLISRIWTFMNFIIVHNVFLLLVIYCCNKASNGIVTRSKELVFHSWIPLSPEVSRLSPYTRELQEAFTYSWYTDYIHLKR